METYRISDLTFSYPGKKKPAVYGLNLSVDQGEFLTVCGPSGCGKSTLLRQLKPVLSPHGVRRGEIRFEGRPLTDLTERSQAEEIGFVLQSPENQIVTDKVWHELAFGLESLGCDTPKIRLREAEMAAFFGIEKWFYQNVAELSGGQKQLLNLASIMAMQPKVLLLDEPTSQLDPIAAAEFLATLGRINRELGVTIILTEHRLEDALPLSHRVAVLEEGRLVSWGTPKEVGAQLSRRESGMFLAMPAPIRIYGALPDQQECPVTVGEGRQWFSRAAEARGLIFPEKDPEEENAGIREELWAVELKEVWFKYEKNGPDILKGLSLQVPAGDIFALMGGNGAGKTTALSVVSGLKRPYRGQVRLAGRDPQEISDKEKFGGLLGVLPQNPQALFVKKTVQEDLAEILDGRKFGREEKASRIKAVAELCRLEELLDRHPYDLSGGEQQRAALAKVLLLEPKVLLLDEPTKGMDAEFKACFAEILVDLKNLGSSILLVSHDIEFCAEYADRCALFFGGAIVTQGRPRRFFSGNSFYTTAANRMCRHLLPEAVTVEDAVRALGGEGKKCRNDSSPARLMKNTAVSDTAVSGMSFSLTESRNAVNSEEHRKAEGQSLPLWRRALAAVCLAALVFTLARGLTALGGFAGLKAFISGGDLAVQAAGEPAAAWKYALFLLIAMTEACLAWFFLHQREAEGPLPEYMLPPKDRRFTSRTLAAVLMILFAIPLTIFVGYYYLADRKYYFISLLIILETMLPFAMIFESRRPQARELVIIAVLCAIGVAGRAAFYFLPQFKPVAAVAILAGVCFGPESGFLVGAVTMFVSNMFVQQGPYTPWQMFSLGIIGFLAGILFRKGLLQKKKTSLCIYGGLSVFFLYGFLMDSANVLIYQSRPTKEMFFFSYLQGLPFNLIFAAATVFFLWVAAKPMIEKLERVKIKYGLMEAAR